jgi:hypothetical protein
MFELLLIIYLLPVLINRYTASEVDILAFEDCHTSGCMAG